jgi:hypothetical protein
VVTVIEEIDELAVLCGLELNLIVKNTYSIVSTVEDYDFLIKLGVFKAKLKKNGYIVLPKSQVSDIGCVIDIIKA